MTRAVFLPVRRRLLLGLGAIPLAAALPGCATRADPLASWRDGAPKQAIIQFVTAVTNAQGPDYVDPDERIAVFDNDGTLWSEQPLYFQVFFMIDQVKAAAPQHPEWANNPAFTALMAGDLPGLARLGLKSVAELLMVANSGMSTQAYEKTIADWLSTARHPRFKRPYTELTYQPMRELLAYLDANGFKNFIVSGGSIEFMRPWVQKAYGIPPERVVGTVSQVELDGNDGAPTLKRLPKLEFMDDGPGKPVGIYRSIGRRPIAAFGNSDGDLQMLQWTAAGSGAHLLGLVHHTDAAREWAYDRESHVGKLDKALDEAMAKGWTVIDMQKDWARVYAFE
jgi:phosphoglycolate phosphatase-like HAD superfamily hydrolase